MFSEIHCIVHGKVQRVGYRDFIQHTAKKLDLTGWVKNKENETVEVLAQGIPDDLKLFIEALHSGSVLAKIDSVAVDWQTPKELHDDFTVIFS
jgi:acylphosphatase